MLVFSVLLLLMYFLLTGTARTDDHKKYHLGQKRVNLAEIKKRVLLGILSSEISFSLFCKTFKCINFVRVTVMTQL